MHAVFEGAILLYFVTTVFHTAFMRLFPEASAFFSASSTRTALGEVGVAIIEQCEGAAHEPTGRVA